MKDLAAEFVAKAAADYDVALLILRDGQHFGPACFHLQQAVEKLFKAALHMHGVEPRYTHNLFELDTTLRAVAPSWACDSADLLVFAPAAVQYRYPGDGPSESDAAITKAACDRLRALLLELLAS